MNYFTLQFYTSHMALIVNHANLISQLVVILYLVHSTQCSAKFREMEQHILGEILGQNYDNRIRPEGKGTNGGDIDGPCEVDVNIMIRSISSIDDVKMEYSLQITFRERWHDSRLNYRKYNLSDSIKQIVLTEPNKIWRPDVFFKNEKQGHFHNIITPNVLLRILPDGTILYSIRISLVLLCPMNLQYFPLDVQQCQISMASYGYTTKDLMFRWKPVRPLEINLTQLYLPRFDLRDYKTQSCDSITTTGTYSCVEGIFYFKREFSYYLFLIYVPCCMLVIVSWVSFWIDPNSTAARVLLGITSLLTMSRQISSINTTLPPVSYIKAVDVWTGCCLIFIFSALIEFAVVNYVSRADATRMGVRRRRPTMIGARKKYDSGKDSGIDSSDIEEAAGAYHKSSGYSVKASKKKAKKFQLFNWWHSRFITRSKKIDVGSRIGFPLLFALFNAFYWTKYLFREELNDHYLN